MAITNREKVTVLESHDVRRCDICILVGFVWVVRSYSSFCCERKLCDNVADFVSFLRNSLGRNWVGNCVRGSVGMGIVLVIHADLLVHSLLKTQL